MSNPRYDPTYKAPCMDQDDVANERIAAIVSDRNALLAECEVLRVENAELRARLEKQ